MGSVEEVAAAAEEAADALPPLPPPSAMQRSASSDAAHKALHRRKSSWLNDSHPNLAWRDEGVRKQLREFVSQEEAVERAEKRKQRRDRKNKSVSNDQGDCADQVEEIKSKDEIQEQQDEVDDEQAEAEDDEDEDEDDDDDDEMDDEDMNFGLDPGFKDIEEELEAVEGMISEHTKIAEVELVDDDGEGNEDANVGDQPSKPAGEDDEENIVGTLELQRSHSEPSRKDRIIKEDDDDEQSSNIAKALKQHELETMSRSAMRDPMSPRRWKTENGNDIENLKIDHKTVLVHKRSTSNRSIDRSADSSSSPQKAPEKEGLPQEEAKSSAVKESSTAQKRVRLVELPDYLAMLAREHKRLLLEKQRRDLALAAQAANAREQQGIGTGAGRGPRSDNMIRRGYLDKLGIAGDSAPISPNAPSATARKLLEMGINARRAAIASARTRRKPPSMRVPLREGASSSKGSGFFNKLASWIGSDEGNSSDGRKPIPQTKVSSSQGSAASSSASSGGSPALGPRGDLSSSPGAVRLRGVNFKEMADVYFIPARSDYPAKVRNAIWHSRAEFVDMVMTNMDQVELEMQQAAEAQRRIQDLRDNPPPELRKKT